MCKNVGMNDEFDPRDMLLLGLVFTVVFLVMWFSSCDVNPSVVKPEFPHHSAYGFDVSTSTAHKLSELGVLCKSLGGRTEEIRSGWKGDTEISIECRLPR